MPHCCSTAISCRFPVTNYRTSIYTYPLILVNFPARINLCIRDCSNVVAVLCVNVIYYAPAVKSRVLCQSKREHSGVTALLRKGEAGDSQTAQTEFQAARRVLGLPVHRFRNMPIVFRVMSLTVIDSNDTCSLECAVSARRDQAQENI